VANIWGPQPLSWWHHWKTEFQSGNGVAEDNAKGSNLIGAGSSGFKMIQHHVNIATSMNASKPASVG